MNGLVKNLQVKYNIYRRNTLEKIREIRQSAYVDKKIDVLAKRVIIFFIEGPWKAGEAETISGGITSIDSIFQVSKTLKTIHNAEVLLCTLTGKRLYKFSTFKSSSVIISLPLLRKFKKLDEVLIHVPEYLSATLLDLFEAGTLEEYLKSNVIHINILNQNIELMPSPAVVENLKKYADKVTQTTAHKNYTSDKFLGKYNIPYHFFSVRIDISQYKFVPLESKEDLILFSPDDRVKNQMVIELLSKSLPQYKFQTIQNLTYDEYKKLIGRAKFCFTFGEGLDGYFVEPFFCGTISFAIFNDSFFTEEYSTMPSIFSSENLLYSNINSVINELKDDNKYRQVVETTNALLTREYNYEHYVNNIKSFYQLHFN